MKPLPESKGEIELYGATLTPGTGGGGTGSFAEFLQWAGRFVEPNRRIIDEVEKRPDGQISWHQNYRSPFDEQTTREDRGDEAVLKHLREAMAVLRSKAQPQEVDDYRSFVVTLAQHVAGAHSEHGQAVDQPEQNAIESVEAALA